MDPVAEACRSGGPRTVASALARAGAPVEELTPDWAVLRSLLAALDDRPDRRRRP